MMLRTPIPARTPAGAWRARLKSTLILSLLLGMVQPGAFQPVSAQDVSPSVIEAFLRGHRIVEPSDTLPAQAYVLAGERERLMSGAGDTLYARGHVPPHTRLGIYRPGARYHDEQGVLLGHELLYIGEARWLHGEGDISQLAILSAHREVLSNDLVLPLEQPLPPRALTPHPAAAAVAGRILAVPGGLRFIGRLQVITLDVGTQDGLQPGHMLQVNQAGALIDDPHTGAKARLPDTPAGQVLVIKPYQRVSYALVTQASHVLEVGDRVVSPIH
ncbi:peptidoglycan-binding protein [Halomonas aquamarina]|uniref:Peptidoglycan-binding protein n=1 Tax=Vreelandella aquamarina TaxID=77097 RepID=A0ACC5VSF2_9GAMM|nr:peptidoglycan-binding protein [Halomonas aquamarina]MBZ5487126.1 peptidoglycan-binding protein [Halomonas aquamarina]